MSRRPNIRMSGEEVRAFLETPRTAVLSTLGPKGLPHMAAMWFAVEWPDPPGGDPGEGGVISMWTYRKSQKARNLFRDLRCGLLVEEGFEYSKLKGVLVRGEARLIDDASVVAGIGRRLYERYTMPHTGVPYEGAAEAEVLRQAPKRVAIMLPVAGIASWDHTKLG